MSEIGDVLAAIEALSAKGERMALATIVAVRGSTYRRPGARLLVPEEGSPVGNISGGCLEGDVADMARVVMDEGRARLAGWDLTADDDAVWGLGLGCNGAIEVFIEPAEKAAEVAGALRVALEEERPISVVTVVESSRAGVEPGARLVVRPDGTSDGSLGDPSVDATAEEAAAQIGQVVEGLTTAPVLRDLSHRVGVELPITEGVCRVLGGESLDALLASLMGRQPTDE